MCHIIIKQYNDLIYNEGEMIELKKRARLQKKLTVRTLSFIMASMLLLLVIPFAAIAAGKENPEPGKKGDFRLFSNFYSASKVTLEAEQTAPIVVSAELGSNEKAVKGYQWQAYSLGQERYVNMAGQTGKEIRITGNLVSGYNYGNGESYLRCQAVVSDSDMQQTLTSDVLTVVLPKEQNDDETQSSQPADTVQTIDLFDPTQPGDTEETQLATEPTQAEVTDSTTEPTQVGETEPTTSPTEAENSEVEKDEPTNDDSEPLTGKLLEPMESEDADSDLPPLRGMLLAPMKAAGENPSYTVVYWLENPNDSNYSVWGTETKNDKAAGTVIHANDFVVPESIHNGIISYFERNDTKNSSAENSNGTFTVAEDGSTIVNVYYNRLTYTIRFNLKTTRNYASVDPVLTVNGRTYDVHRYPNDKNHYLYDLIVKLGQDVTDVWPTEERFTSKPTTAYKYYCGVYYATSVNTEPTVYETTTITANLIEHATANRIIVYKIDWSNVDTTINATLHYLVQPLNLSENHNDYNEVETENKKIRGTKLYSNSNVTYHPLQYKTFDGFVAEGEMVPVNSSTTHYYFYYTRETHDVIVHNSSEIYQTISNVPYEQYIKNVSGSFSPSVQPPYPCGYSSSTHQFDGWYTSPEYEESEKVTEAVWNSLQMETADINLFAHWVERSVVASTLTIYTRNDEDTVITHSGVEEATSLSSYQPAAQTKTGHNFGGWYYDDGTFAQAVDWANDTMPSADTSIYAKWIPHSHQFTVRFKDDLGNEIPHSSDSKDYGTVIAVPTGLTWENHTPTNEWYYDSDFANPVTWSITMPDQDITVYAQWTINKYTVEFYYSPGLISTENLYTATNVVYGTHIQSGLECNFGVDNKLDVLKDQDTVMKAFDGWYYDADSPDNPSSSPVNEQTFQFGDSGTPITSNMKVYAKWVPKYNVNFYSKEVSGTLIQTYCVREGGTLDETPASPTEDGWAFDAWYYNAGTVEEPDPQPFISAVIVEKNIDVYATWKEKVISIAITNGGQNANIFEITKQDGSQDSGSVVLTVAVQPGAANKVTVVRLPYTDENTRYRVSVRSRLGKNWDFRHFYSNDILVNEEHNGVLEAEQSYEVTFGEGTSRSLNWLGGQTFIG